MRRFAILKTNHTGITVSDIDRSLAFFGDVLGFEVTEKVRHDGRMIVGQYPTENLPA